MNIFKKIIFLWKKPCVILVTGKGRSCAAEAIFQVLKSHFRVKKISNGVFPLVNDKDKILIFETDFDKSSKVSFVKNFKFLLKKSKLPILLVTHVGEIPADKEFFAGEKKETFLMRKMAEILPVQGFLILNFDDETVREIKNETVTRSFTYGFQKGADFRATDININLEGTNFKINYEGNIVPFWLRNLFGKEQIYSVLPAIAVGIVKDINLVEIFQALKSYQSLPGKMRLIEGIKKSLILDDSENATAFSMIEALEILRKIGEEARLRQGFGLRPTKLPSADEVGGQGRKIAVLGDVLGVGKYTIEAHETIGEKVAKNGNLLFAVGSRAKFIAKGARSKGMKEENIFQFNTVNEAKLRLQKEIKEGDIILVDGSKEMKMGEVIEEIKK